LYTRFAFHNINLPSNTKSSHPKIKCEGPINKFKRILEFFQNFLLFKNACLARYQRKEEFKKKDIKVSPLAQKTLGPRPRLSPISIVFVFNFFAFWLPSFSASIMFSMSLFMFVSPSPPNEWFVSGFYRATECPSGSSYLSQDNDPGDEDKHGLFLHVWGKQGTITRLLETNQPCIGGATCGWEKLRPLVGLVRR